MNTRRFTTARLRERNNNEEHTNTPHNPQHNQNHSNPNKKLPDKTNQQDAQPPTIAQPNPTCISQRKLPKTQKGSTPQGEPCKNFHPHKTISYRNTHKVEHRKIARTKQQRRTHQHTPQPTSTQTKPLEPEQETTRTRTHPLLPNPTQLVYLNENHPDTQKGSTPKGKPCKFFHPHKQLVTGKYTR